MSGDTEKRAGFEKWLKRLANDLRVTVEYGRSALPILRREVLPLLEMIDAQDGLLICYRLQSRPSDKLLDNLKRLRTKLDKIRSES